VSQLIKPVTDGWDVQLVTDAFIPIDAEDILTTPTRENMGMVP
jgi:hypothetical protein